MSGSGTYWDLSAGVGRLRKLLSGFSGASGGGRALGTRSDGRLDPSIHPINGLGTSKMAPGVHLGSTPNGNFEDGLDGWATAATGTGTAAVIDATAGNQVTGQNSAKMVLAASGDTASVTAPMEPCGAGDLIYVFARAKSANGKATLTAVVTFYDRTKTAIAAGSGGTVTVFTQATLPASFGRYGAQVTPPAGACYRTTTFTASAAADTVWFDEGQQGRALLSGGLAPAQTLTGLTTTGDRLLNGTSSIALALSSQPTPNWGSHHMAASSTKTGGMEFFDAQDIAVNTGASDRSGDANAYKAAKVGRYTGMTCGSGGGDTYAINTDVNSNAGHPGAAIGFESDINDYNKASTSGQFACATTFAAIASGAAASPIRAHIYCAGNNNSPLSGVVLANFSYNLMGAARFLGAYGGQIAGPVLEDNCGATHVIKSIGSKNYGIDLTGCTFATNYALNLNYGHIINFLSPNSGASGTITYNAGGALILAGQQIGLGTNTLPTVDNAYLLGNGSFRFSGVYSAGGVSTSSDRELKDDIADLDQAKAVAFVEALKPSTWRWKVGGHDVTEEQEEHEVHATEEVRGTATVAEAQPDGTVVHVEREHVDTVHLFDTVPLIDPATGEQKTTVVPARAATDPVFGLDADGQPIELVPGRAAEPERVEPLFTQVPRMETATRTVQKLVPRPGKRTHAGFIYQDVEALVEAMGLDLGITDKADGECFLRMEKFIPLLVATVQAQDARIKALEALIGSHSTAV